MRTRRRIKQEKLRFFLNNEMVTQRSCLNGDAHTREASVGMATLNEYRSTFRLLSKHEVITERRKLFEPINGDAFFPLKAWPKEYQRIF